MDQNRKHGRNHEVIVDIRGFHGTPLFVTVAVCIGLSLIGYLLQWRSGFQDIGTIILIASAIYIASSFQTVQQEEIALIRLFGQGLYRVDAGLVFVPRFFMELDRESRLDFQDIFPGPDDKIYYGDLDNDNAVIPPGMVRPIRTLFGPPKQGDAIPDPKNAPYHKQMVAGVKFGVNWYIYDLLKFRNTIGTPEKASAQLEATAKGVFRSQFAKATPAVIAMRLQEESDVLEHALDAVVEAWGVDIISSPIESLDFSHDLNKSVTKTGEVEQQAIQLEISSTAEAAQIERLGTARAGARRKDVQVDIDAVKGKLTARAEGLEKIKGLADVTGLKVLELEATRAGLETNPNLVIIAGEEGIAKSVASVGRIFGGAERKETKK